MRKEDFAGWIVISILIMSLGATNNYEPVTIAGSTGLLLSLILMAVTEKEEALSLYAILLLVTSIGIGSIGAIIDDAPVFLIGVSTMVLGAILFPVLSRKLA